MNTTDTTDTTQRPTSLRPAHHQPTCPATDGAASPVAACTVAAHPEQGWSLLCNGVVLFDDGGYLLPATPLSTPASTPTSTAPAVQPVAA